jgi:hypothetical protein
MTDPPGRAFLLRLRSLRPDDETTRNLRLVLKKLLRQWHFQCLDIREIHNEGGNDDGQET